MLGSKLTPCAETYSYKSWLVVSQDRYSVQDIEQMERELCEYLGWRLDISHDALDALRASLSHEFALSVPDSDSGVGCDVVPWELATELEHVARHGYEFLCLPSPSTPLRSHPVLSSPSSSSSFSSVSSPPFGFSPPSDFSPPPFGSSPPSTPSSSSSQETSTPHTPDLPGFVDSSTYFPDDILHHPLVKSTLRSRTSLLWTQEPGIGGDGDDYGLPIDPLLCLEGTAMHQDMHYGIMFPDDYETPVSIVPHALRIPTVPLPRICFDD